MLQQVRCREWPKSGRFRFGKTSSADAQVVILMFLQLSKIVERIGARQLTGVDQRHEQIASFSAGQRATSARSHRFDRVPVKTAFAC